MPQQQSIPKKPEITLFRFLRTQDPDGKLDYYDAIKTPSYVPKEIAGKVRELHDNLADQMTHVPEKMYFTFPVNTDTEAFILCGFASKVKDSKSRGYARLAVVAASRADLIAADIDPVAVLAGVPWDESADWSAAKVNLKILRELTINDAARICANTLDQRDRPVSMSDWSNSSEERLFSTFSAFLRKDKQESVRYSVSIGLYVPAKLKFPVSFDFHVPAPVAATPPAAAKKKQATAELNEIEPVVIMQMNTVIHEVYTLELDSYWSHRIWNKCQDLWELELRCQGEPKWRRGPIIAEIASKYEAVRKNFKLLGVPDEITGHLDLWFNQRYDLPKLNSNEVQGEERKPRRYGASPLNLTERTLLIVVILSVVSMLLLAIYAVAHPGFFHLKEKAPTSASSAAAAGGAKKSGAGTVPDGESHTDPAEVRRSRRVAKKAQDDAVAKHEAVVAAEERAAAKQAKAEERARKKKADEEAAAEQKKLDDENAAYQKQLDADAAAAENRAAADEAKSRGSEGTTKKRH